MKTSGILAAAGFALLFALAAGVGTWRFLARQAATAEKARLETVGIVVALVDIPLGQTINPNQVAVAAWPRGTHPPDAFHDVKSVAGRVARRDFARGEPIVEAKLVPANRAAGLLSLRVPEGLRAFSVKVNEVVGVGGFVVPDSRVDVIVTTAASPERQQDQVAKLFLQNVLVLAAGQSIEQRDNKPVTVNTVTLAVTPEEAERLALASNDGKIQLVLRNFSDGARVETPGSDKRQLLGSFRRPAARTAARRAAPPPARGASPATTPATAPAPVVASAHTVEIIRGGKRSVERFE